MAACRWRGAVQEAWTQAVSVTGVRRGVFINSDELGWESLAGGKCEYFTDLSLLG